MKMKKSMQLAIIAPLLAFSCFSSAAGENTDRERLQKLVQCKASVEDVLEFNTLLDNKTLALKTADEYQPWGGLAWHVSPAIKMGDLSSDIAIANTRTSYYLRIGTRDAAEKVKKVVSELKLVKVLDEDGYVSYRGETIDGRTFHALNTEDKTVYWVGCSYDLPPY